MIHILRQLLAFALALLTLLPFLRRVYRRGELGPIGDWWHRASRGKRFLILMLLFSTSAYAVDKLLRLHVNEALADVSHAITSLCTNAFESIEQQTGYAIAAARTNEVHDLSMPERARQAENIARRGAHNDGFWLFDSWTNRLAREGLDIEHPVWVQTDGTVTVRSPSPGIPIEELSLYTTYSNITIYAPLQGSYGFLPGSRWPEFNVSRIWMAVTDRGTRIITWEGALRDRDAAQPVSFQAEFHKNGDITYRYSPAQTNFTGIGLYRGGSAMSLDRSTVEPFNRWGDEPATNGLPTSDFALSTLELSYIGDLGDGTGDADEDCLTDWQEIKVYHTDPHLADTDCDGLMDGYEVVNGTDPLNPDTDGDGIPDGTTAEEIASSPLLATNAATVNLTLSFSMSREGGRGVFHIGGLRLIVTNGTSLNLSLPQGEGVPYEFHSLEFSGVSVAFSGGETPVLASDPEGLFAGGARLSASGRILAGELLELHCVDDSITGPCVHEQPGTRQYRVTLGDGEWDYWRQYAVMTGENADTETLTLHVADDPPSSASLTVAFPVPMMLVGGLSASVSIHRCEAGNGDHEYCTICGDYPRHSRGLGIAPSRACIGVGTGESASFSVTPDSYAQTPAWTISPSVAGGPTLIDGGNTVIVHAGTTTGVFTLTASGEGCSDSATVIVYGVDYLTIESSAFPTAQETVHFPGMMPHPFNVTNSPVPDLHQPFFFKDAQNNFAVPPFTVDLKAHFVPDAVTDDDVDCEWSLVSEGVAGTFSDAAKATARFTPTTRGGVYRFSFACGSLTNSEANLVLPLSGARIDEIVLADLARADAFAANVLAKYTWWQRNTDENGERWFYKWNAGDYVGRPDNAFLPTVWAYNQVDTVSADVGNLGCCTTLCGLPVRLTKVSNFIVGYACEKIGVSTANQVLAQLRGTLNDSSALTSWWYGVAVANGDAAAPALTNLVQTIWNGSGIKGPRLWPNPSPPDNYIQDSLMMNDADREFASPRFLNMSSP